MDQESNDWRYSIKFPQLQIERIINKFYLRSTVMCKIDLFQLKTHCVARSKNNKFKMNKTFFLPSPSPCHMRTQHNIWFYPQCQCIHTILSEQFKVLVWATESVKFATMINVPRLLLQSFRRSQSDSSSSISLSATKIIQFVHNFLTTPKKRQVEQHDLPVKHYRYSART